MAAPASAATQSTAPAAKKAAIVIICDGYAPVYGCQYPDYLDYGWAGDFYRGGDYYYYNRPGFYYGRGDWGWGGRSHRYWRGGRHHHHHHR
ncbi:hypothetical protein [Cryptosporangium sp. NPDC048952]|uniref:hypothetical protein n=1 Tax=Cryptosporangium sp. NPDC048952 TaxID=3363961 RepID=UPI0037208991